MHHEWKPRNRFALLPGGKCYIPAMLAAIDGAKVSILFEQYLMESGQHADLFIDALARAAQRGVSVCVLLDAYGTKGLKKKDRQRMARAGIAVRDFNPLSRGRIVTGMTRDHRKLVLVDQHLAFTGGYCITDEFLDWYDVVVRIEGPVIQDWTAQFSQLWFSSLTHGARPAALPENMACSREPICHAEDMRGRMIWGRGHRYQAIRFSLQKRIMAARQRVWICTPYFLPTPSLRQRMMAAAQRGIDVRLLVAGPKHDHPSVRYAGQRFYTQLLRAGVRIHEYQPTFTHAKFCLVDDWATIGSCNFDHWSLRWNLEANQEVEDARFASDVRRLFEDNFAVSEEIDPRCWAQRPWWQWCRERILGTANAWLTLLR